MKHYLDLFARLLLSLFFGYEAYDTFAHVADTREKMSEFGLTFAPNLLLWGSVVCLVLGSILLAVGYRSKLAAFLLFIYWVPVSLIAYAFWNETGQQLRIEALLLMSRMAIAGALLLVMAHGTGRFAVKKLLATARTPV